HLPRFAFDAERPQRIHVRYHMHKPPTAADFHLLELRTRNGRTLAARVAWRTEQVGSLWLDANLGWSDTGFREGEGGQIELDLRLLDATKFELRLNGHQVGTALFLKTADPVTTVYIGGNAGAPEACDVTVESVSYGTRGS